jgi:hypothetical protein
MEADLRRHYGVSMRDVIERRVTRRELVSLVKGMPEDSALFRSVNGADAVTWTPVMHRLTDVADLLQVANYQRTDGKGPAPSPITRPA